MIIRLQIAIYVFLIFSCSCNNSEAEKLNSLKKNAALGDISSYEELSSYYFRNGIVDSLFPYTKAMAQKYNYSRAYYDMFEIIYLSSDSLGCTDYNLSCLGNEERGIALSYLTKAIKMRELTASETLLNYYNIGKSYPIRELYENKELIKIARSNVKDSKTD